MAFKSKAETMFDKKMKVAVDNRDWNQVTRLFHLYGFYLELVEPLPVDTTPQETTGKELVYVQPDEPTAHEEQEYLLSGGHAEFCIRTLHRDPVTLQPLTEEQLAEHGLVK